MHKIIFIFLILMLAVGITLSWLPMKDYKNQINKYNSSVTKKDKDMMLAGHIVSVIAIVIALLWLAYCVFSNKIWFDKY